VPALTLLPPTLTARASTCQARHGDLTTA
jgi:hypothetical protein